MLRANVHFLDLAGRLPKCFAVRYALLFDAVRTVPQPAVSQRLSAGVKRQLQRSQRVLNLQHGVLQLLFKLVEIARRFDARQNSPAQDS